MWNLKKTNLIETEIRFVVARGGVRVVELSEGGQEVQTSSYKFGDVISCFTNPIWILNRISELTYSKQNF